MELKEYFMRTFGQRNTAQHVISSIQWCGLAINSRFPAGIVDIAGDQKRIGSGLGFQDNLGILKPNHIHLSGGVKGSGLKTIRFFNQCRFFRIKGTAIRQFRIINRVENILWSGRKSFRNHPGAGHRIQILVYRRFPDLFLEPPVVVSGQFAQRENASLFPIRAKWII